MGTSRLWQIIQSRQLTTLAVMGMTKNTGKTVCLNHLLAQAAASAVAVGVTSIGRDGEERDQVFSIPKPPVLVCAGAWVATARDTLLRAKVRYRTLGGTGIDSPLGEIVIVRTLDGGEMEIAGASRSRDQRTVIGLLKQCGARLIFLDGALGRSHHASPAIADAVVLATGAAIGGGIADVLRKTQDRLAILGVSAADSEQAGRTAPVINAGRVGVWTHTGQCIFDQAIPTLNAAGALLSVAERQEVATVAVAGAVGRGLWDGFGTLLARNPGLEIVVSDGTKLFVDAADLRAFAQAGGRLRALRSISMLGVTLNPFSPFGGSFDAAEFLCAAREMLPEYVVTDVMHEAKADSIAGANV